MSFCLWLWSRALALLGTCLPPPRQPTWPSRASALRRPSQTACTTRCESWCSCSLGTWVNADGFWLLSLISQSKTVCSEFVAREKRLQQIGKSNEQTCDLAGQLAESPRLLVWPKLCVLSGRISIQSSLMSETQSRCSNSKERNHGF